MEARSVSQPSCERDLHLRHKRGTLAYSPYTDGEEFRFVAFGGRVNWCSTSRAKSLYSSCAAFSGLYIDGRLAGGDLECVAGDSDDDTKCRSGETLAVGAMADGGPFEVSLDLVGDVTAVTAAIDFHDRNPPSIRLG